MNAETLQSRAQKLARKILQDKANPAFRRAMNVLASQGMIQWVAPGERRKATKIDIEDLEFAARVEPRILELLPAVFIRRPAILRSLENVSHDLKELRAAVARGRPTADFRGVPVDRYMRWVDAFGRKPTSKVRMTAMFIRLSASEVSEIEGLKRDLGYRSAADVIRAGIAKLKSQNPKI